MPHEFYRLCPHRKRLENTEKEKEAPVHRSHRNLAAQNPTRRLANLAQYQHSPGAVPPCWAQTNSVKLANVIMELLFISVIIYKGRDSTFYQNSLKNSSKKKKNSLKNELSGIKAWGKKLKVIFVLPSTQKIRDFWKLMLSWRIYQRVHDKWWKFNSANAFSSPWNFQCQQDPQFYERSKDWTFRKINI